MAANDSVLKQSVARDLQNPKKQKRLDNKLAISAVLQNQARAP
jgi:hypothetical protein